ncbi:VOC family protein [Actinopolymorpha rutila]|uniref:Putative glyoxalase superfamily protein PhnB n=1 Tax=Actinopolymorpha rutila TaxID=446787 RepID=A0A852Z913_9ACTN|nr:VOC family protein [Actinopolymorpha rutila]NYH88705.1 putative glyoxalase superfamily protein PhnB [Actinopolymorpha rutila]
MSTVAFTGQSIFCADVEKSAQFYEQTLGFVRQSVDDGDLSLAVPLGGSGTTHSATVNLLLHHSDDPQPVDLGTFETDDVDALIDQVHAAGCEITTEPADAPWGVREAGFRDPDGNGLYVTARANG